MHSTTLENYCSTIAGSCKNNSQIKNQFFFGNYEPNQKIKLNIILGKNKLMEILDSFKLQPRQRAIKGCILTR